MCALTVAISPSKRVYSIWLEIDDGNETMSLHNIDDGVFYHKLSTKIISKSSLTKLSTDFNV